MSNYYHEEDCIKFIEKVENLAALKDDRECYWIAYKSLQDWLQENNFSTGFISYVERNYVDRWNAVS